ncbi:ankyrin repeat-containing domain protein [Copromyces sp. CBS 386.78]|nr:ankyrin repeat-containing domain protein [Copromyces sp. CBS 386.78]
MLLDREAEVDAPAGWALQIAAGRGHIEVVHRLLLADADANRVIDKPQFPPCTTIQAACEGGYDDVVKLLLDHGANPNTGGGQLGYPIVAAARFGFPDILTMLICKEADVNVTGGESNESPLVFASSFLPASSAIQLLDAGANINYTDNDGDTPLTMAAWAGDSELVMVLLKRGANPLHVTKRGVNALQYALLANRTECVRVLGDWLSLVLLGIHKAAHAGDEAPVRDVLKRTNYAGLRREVVEMQKAASKQLDEYTSTDFFLDEGVDVRSAGSNDDTHAGNTGNGVDHGDGQDKRGDHEAHIGSVDRSVGHRNRANDEAEEAKADANEAQDRNGDDDGDVEGEGNDEDGEDRGAENHQNRGDDEYTIVQGTAHMRLSEDEGSQSMKRGYDEDNSGNGSDAGDGHDNGEDDNMMDDEEY